MRREHEVGAVPRPQRGNHREWEAGRFVKEFPAVPPRRRGRELVGQADEVTLPDPEVLRLYRLMVLNRTLDERMITLQRQGRIGFYIGSIGEEAAVLGSAAAMLETDWIFPCYRELGAALLRGMPLVTFVCDLLGNAGDVMKGRQMPCHEAWRPVTSPRSPRPSRRRSRRRSAPPGRAAEGRRDGRAHVLRRGRHERARLPHRPQLRGGAEGAGGVRLPQQRLGDQRAAGAADRLQDLRAEGGRLRHARRARRRQRPPRGHPGRRGARRERAARRRGPDADRGAHLPASRATRPPTTRASTDPAELVEPWKKKDPILRMRRYLGDQAALDDAADEKTRAEVRADHCSACCEAEAFAPKPPLETMFEDVYAEPPWHLREQLAELEAAIAGRPARREPAPRRLTGRGDFACPR